MAPGVDRPGPAGDGAPGLAARQAAAQILSGVLDNGASFSALIEAANSPLSRLPPADRSLARAIAATSLRRHGQIRAVLGELIERPLPSRSGSLPHILEVAVAQILFMDVPDHAAVSVALAMAEADGKARHFKPLANGVLRTLIRRRDELLARHGAARLNVPVWLWRRWTAAYGESGAAAIAEAHLSEAPLDISVKSDGPSWAHQLSGEILPTGTVRCVAKGRVEDLPGYADGAWWVQDAAAALPTRLLGDVAGKAMLDLCAAPGGKTAELAAAGAKVTAVDISPARMRRLADNLKRLRLEAECITADALSFEPGRLYDAVLLDAPCSSTGTIRRHPDIPWVKQEADIAKLAKVQRNLLAKAASLTRPGGTLVFATCSLEPEEGEAQADWAVATLPLQLKPIKAGEIAGLDDAWVTGGRLRTLPNFQPGPGVSGGMDGFFAARLVKG